MNIILASESSSVVTAADWAQVLTALTAQVSVATIVSVLAMVVSACIGIVFMWWGLRKAIRAFMASWKSGKLKV